MKAEFVVNESDPRELPVQLTMEAETFEEQTFLRSLLTTFQRGGSVHCDCGDDEVSGTMEWTGPADYQAE